MILHSDLYRRQEDTTPVKGIGGRPVGGSTFEMTTHLGSTQICAVRQGAPGGSEESLAMSWTTAPVPRKADTKKVTFVWTGAMGKGLTRGGNFTLFVNGRAAADFDVTPEPTRFLSRAQGCELLYDVLWVGRDCIDSSGWFYLTVPAEWVKRGESAAIEVRANPVGSGRWFGLPPSEDGAVSLPRRTWWCGFARHEQQNLPPPEAQEASYEWHLPHYADPDMWTPVGQPMDPAEAAVSPTGQLISVHDNIYWRSRITGTVPGCFTGGLAFALYDGQDIVPVGAGEPAVQALVEGHMPIVTTSWRYEDIDLIETAFAEPLRGDSYENGDESTLAWAALDLTSRGSERRQIVLLAFISDGPMDLTFQDGVVLDSGSALFCAHLPEGFEVEFAPMFPADAGSGQDNPLELLREGSAVLNALVVRGRIDAGGTARVVFNRVFDFPGLVHWRPETRPTVAPQELTARSFEKGLCRARAVWSPILEKASRFSTPDPVLDNIYRKALLDGYILTKRWQGRHIVLDSVVYREQFDDASTKWFYTLDLVGDHETSEKLLDTVFERQGQRRPAGTRTREGCFSDVTNTTRDGSVASWTSCNGWALWAMAEHARLANDRAWFERHKPQILDGCEWIIRERSFSKEEPGNPCAGLLYGKFVCDLNDEGPVSGIGYFTYTDAISYMGLRSTAQLLRDWGHPEAQRLLQESEDYRRDIAAAVDRLTDRSSDPWYVPWMLHAPNYEDRLFYDVVGPINLAFGGVLPRDDERISHVIRWIIERTHGGSIEEATAGTWEGHEGTMFYSQDLAVVLLELGRVEDFLSILYTLLACNVSHRTLTACECQSNTQPHIHSTSSLVRMVRTMLVQERDGGLYLLQGTPRRWLEDGKQIRIEKGPTWYGPLSLGCRSKISEGLIRLHLGVPERLGEAPIHVKLRLPRGARIEGVTLTGRGSADLDGEWIVLRGLSDHALIEAHVAPA
jgi:hypothetical protein